MYYVAGFRGATLPKSRPIPFSSMVLIFVGRFETPVERRIKPMKRAQILPRNETKLLQMYK